MSGDWGLGVPFNFTQYATLVHLIAQVTDLKPGLFTHVINNAHIYENHVPMIKEQIKRLDIASKIAAPKLEINPDIKDFYDFTIDDICLNGYNDLGVLKMKVAV